MVDSFSTDQTEAIARRHGVRFVQHPFAGFGSQRNWALDNLPGLGDWVLFLDADERVTPELGRELLEVLRACPDEVGAYRLRRRFHLWGRWLPRSSLYPTWVVRLVRRGRVRYVDRGHAETQVVEGQVRELAHDLIDENLRGLHAWFARQNDYSTQEARREHAEALGHDLASDLTELLTADPLARRASLKRLGARLPLRGAWYFAYSYLVRGGWQEGREGLQLCLMRAIYEQMIAIKRFDEDRRRVPPT